MTMGGARDDDAAARSAAESDEREQQMTDVARRLLAQCRVAQEAGERPAFARTIFLTRCLLFGEGGVPRGFVQTTMARYFDFGHGHKDMIRHLLHTLRRLAPGLNVHCDVVPNLQPRGLTRQELQSIEFLIWIGNTRPQLT